MAELAARIRRHDGVGFADFTITRRLPKIASDVMATLDAPGARAIQSMVDDLVAGHRIDTSAFARPSPFWSARINELAGATWSDLTFFDVEFLVYHGFNSIAGTYDGGTDVFRAIRAAALAEALEESSPADIGSSQDQLRSALARALFGNEFDYSLLPEKRAEAQAPEQRILVDHRDELVEALLGEPEIHFIADNAGRELLADLRLVDLILGARIDVVMHLKPWPMFVSDALIDDVERTAGELAANGRDAAARALGRRLTGALSSRHLRLAAHPSWGEPRHFNALDPELAAELERVAVVIAKGDLNYRRFVEDRAWPVDTPLSVAAAAVPFSAFALRVIKSEALVGVPLAVAARAAAERPDWLTAGLHAVIQKMR